MDRNLALELVRVTEAAALAAARFMGKGDPIAADRAAAAAMALAIKGVKVTGHIVIGEREDIPGAELCAGRSVGSGEEPEVDLALDPLEGMCSLADGQGNAISAIALAPKGSMRSFSAPMMRKIAVGPEAAGMIDIDEPVFDNLVRIAEARRVYVEDLTVAILRKERHEELIEEVRRAGARIELVRDGDLASTFAAAVPGTGIDVVLGTGDASHAVISAAAMACLGGDLQGRIVIPGEDEEKGSGERIAGSLIEGTLQGGEGDEPDTGRIYRIEDLSGTDNIMFAATGVSRCAFLDGVNFRPGGAVTHSIALRSVSGTIRHLRTEHFFDKEPDYT